MKLLQNENQKLLCLDNMDDLYALKRCMIMIRESKAELVDKDTASKIELVKEYYNEAHNELLEISINMIYKNLEQNIINNQPVVFNPYCGYNNTIKPHYKILKES